MQTNMNFSLCNRAVKKSRVTLYMSAIVGSVLASFAAAIMLYALISQIDSMKFYGAILIVIMIVLVILFWVASLFVILLGVINANKWFEKVTGLIICNDDYIQVGRVNIKRSFIISAKKNWSKLVIKYMDDKKKYQVVLPISWFPDDLANELLRNINEPKKRTY